jgi:hypothetical protein
MLVFMVSTFLIISSFISKKKSTFAPVIEEDKQKQEMILDSYDSSSSYEPETSDDSDDGKQEISESKKPRKVITRRRINRYQDMDLLSHGQKIRYVYENRECLGIFNVKSRRFVNEKGEKFETPSAFARNHLLELKKSGRMLSERETFQVNGWKDCECEVNGSWVSLDEYVKNIRKFFFEI